MPFSPVRFSAYARDLADAVYGLSRKRTMTTIADQLKAARAQLAEARQAASDVVAESTDAARLVMQEVEKAKKEAADLRAEVAAPTNGGPPLEDEHHEGKTPVPDLPGPFPPFPPE
jgi:hypothetical protein